MTTRKITLSLLMAVALMVALAGCSKSSAPEATPGGRTSPATEAPANSDESGEDEMEVFVAPNTPENTDEELKALEEAYKERKAKEESNQADSEELLTEPEGE